jgi:hypothetical protein
LFDSAFISFDFFFFGLHERLLYLSVVKTAVQKLLQSKMDNIDQQQQQEEQEQQKSSALSSASTAKIIQDHHDNDCSTNTSYSNNNTVRTTVGNKNNNLSQRLDAMTIGAATLLPSTVDDNQQGNSIPAAAIVGERPSATATATNPTTNTTTTTSLATQERENFLLFIKILFKILDDNSNEPHTKAKAKHIVLECRRRNTLGDPNYVPLMDAVEVRLKRFIGESVWTKAHILLHHYITKHRPGQRSRIDSLKGTKQQRQPIPVMVGGKQP